MNAEAAAPIAESFLRGAFAVLDSRQSLSFQCELETAQEVTDARLDDMTSRRPVAFQGKVQNGRGAVALLLGTAGAAQVGAVLRGADAAADAVLSGEDRQVLQDICEPFLGGGLAAFFAQCGHEAEQLEEVKLVDDPGGVAAELKALLGDEAAAVAFTFHAGEDVSGQGIFLCNQTLADLLPADTPESAAVAGDAAPATLSREEMNDILGRFGPGAGEMPAAEQVPENLDRILDIRLQATARLGRVEMPISGILDLSPGSIIEVGHLVDEPVELLINNKPIARGDIVVVDEKFGLRITEIISQKKRIESLG